MGNEDGWCSVFAACFQTDDEVCEFLGKYLVFLLFGESGVLGSVKASVKAGESCDLYPTATPGVNSDDLRLGDDFHLSVALECIFEEFKLLLGVVIGCASHDNDRGDLFEQSDIVRRRPVLAEASVAPYLCLVEHIARYHDEVRAFLRRLYNESVKATAEVKETGVFAVLFRAGVIADVPIACMQNLHLPSPPFSPSR